MWFEDLQDGHRGEWNNISNSESICCSDASITKTHLFKYMEKFHLEKTEIFQIKTPIFFIFLLKT